MIHYGIGFPLERSGPHGFMVFKTDREIIKDSITQIFGTRWGERRKIPEFYCNLPLMLFESLTEENKRLIAWIAMDAIDRWEKRIVLKRAEILQSLKAEEQGIVRIDLYYQLIATGEHENMSIYLSKHGVIDHV